MKRLPLLLAVLALITVTIGAGFNAAGGKKNQLIGRWEMQSGEYGGQSTTTPDVVEIKMISASHYLYLAYDKKSMKSIGVGSGSYSYDGDTYTEHVNFSERVDSPEAKQLIGKELSFKVKVEGDTMTQTGQLLGRDLKEVYKRAD
jgi:hypothetical protein